MTSEKWYAVVGFLLLGVLFWRLVWPDMKSASGATTVAPTATGGGASTAAPPPRSMKGWAKKNIWSILVILIGIAAVYWGYNTQVTTKEAGIWAQKHWPAVLIAWGVISAVVALNGWPTSLHWLSGLVVALFLIILPFIGWWVNEDPPPVASKKATTVREVIPLKSHPRSTWPKMVLPAGGKSEQIPLPSGMHHIRVEGDKFSLLSLYADGNVCVRSTSAASPACPDGAVLENQVINESTEPNTVIYAFVPN